MPFGRFKDFADCMNQLKAKYPDQATRQKVCGKMQSELGGPADQAAAAKQKGKPF